MRHFTFVFSHYVFEIWCVVYTDSTSQFVLVTFQGLKKKKKEQHVWLRLLYWSTPVYIHCILLQMDETFEVFLQAIKNSIFSLNGFYPHKAAE